MMLLMLSVLVLMVCSVQADKPSTMEETVMRLEADMKSYKAETNAKMAVMNSTIHNFQQELNKCSCGLDVDSDLKSVIKKHREERQVSSAVLTDALSAFMNHFQQQGIEVPGVSKSVYNGSTSSFSSGSVYTRWGRTTCDDADLIYRGFTAGSWYGVNTGGGANYLCLPSDGAEYNKYNEAAVRTTKISGTEYQSHNYGIFPNDAHDKNVPCARCYSQRSAKMMLPARRTCPTGWTREYEGYLMTTYDGDNGSHDRSMFECVDSEPEYVQGYPDNTDGAVFYFVTPDCDGAGTTGHCPPYHPNRQLTCVLCTK